MDIQAITDAIQANPALVEGLMPIVFDSEQGKKAIENRVETAYKEKIGAEVSKIHGQYDDDVFSIIGERPQKKEDGTQEKSYEFIKRKMTDLKRLSGIESELNADARLKALQKELEDARAAGGGSHYKELYESTKTEYTKKEQDLLKQIQEITEQSQKTSVLSLVATASTELKFNPDFNEAVKKIILDTAEKTLVANAKKREDGKVIFYNGEGNVMQNPTTYEPMTAAEALASMPAVQAILLKNDNGGGGAPPEVKGNIKTVVVEGKDVKTLNLPQGSFKTKMEFITVAEKALMDAGYSRRDKEWDDLKNAAYTAYNVNSLPMQ